MLFQPYLSLVTKGVPSVNLFNSVQNVFKDISCLLMVYVILLVQLDILEVLKLRFVQAVLMTA